MVLVEGIHEAQYHVFGHGIHQQVTVFWVSLVKVGKVQTHFPGFIRLLYQNDIGILL